MSLAEEECWFEGVMVRDTAERPLCIDIQEGGRWIHVGRCCSPAGNTGDRKAEPGITIGVIKYWNNGDESDTMRTLLRHAFDLLNLNQVSL
jgi:hypothetical protein